MSNDDNINNNEKAKKVTEYEHFESNYASLWEKLKLQYMEFLQNDLLNNVRPHISKPSYESFFKNLKIIDLDFNKNIVFSTDSKIKMEWLDTRYASLIRRLLEKIT